MCRDFYIVLAGFFTAGVFCGVLFFAYLWIITTAVTG